MRDFSKRIDQPYRLYCTDEWVQWRQVPGVARWCWYSSDHGGCLSGQTSGNSELPRERPCNPSTGAFTDALELHALTWCPNAFTQFPPDPSDPEDPHRYLKSLDNLKQNQKQIKKGHWIHHLDSIPGQFVHEMSHILGHVDPAGKFTGPSKCYPLAASKQFSRLRTKQLTDTSQRPTRVR